MNQWSGERLDHAQRDAALGFKKNGWDRRNADLTELRVLIVALDGSTTPQKVAVGQAITNLKLGEAPRGAYSLTDYPFPKIVDALLPKTPLGWAYSPSSIIGLVLIIFWREVITPL